MNPKIDKKTQKCLIPFAISLCLLLSLTTFAQNGVDSLLGVLAKSKEDSNKVKLLNEIASAYFNTDDAKTRQYNTEAISLARKIKFLNGEAKAINNLGIITQKAGNYDSALVLQKQALAIYTKINSQKGIAKANSDICLVYWRKADFATALAYQLKALRFYEQVKDEKGLSYCYNMIGIIYRNLKKDDEAISYYLKAIEIRKRINDERGLAASYQNIGNIYKSRLIEDTAMMYYSNSVALHKKFNNKNAESTVISSMGDLKYEFKKYEEAKKYYLLALEVNKNAIDSNILATMYINIGNVKCRLKDFKNGEADITKGLNMLHKLGDKEGVMSAYEMLAYSYQDQKNYEKALESYHAYILMRDSIMSNKEKEEVAELQTKYEVEKKDLQLAKNTAELEAKEKQNFIKNIIIVSVIVLIILVIVIAFIIYRKKQVEQKAELDAEIAAQKEIRIKSIIEAEEKERRRIAQDLHDGVGQILSAAKLNLSGLESQIHLESPKQKDAFKNALDLIDDSVKEVRAVSHNMMPNTLIKLGLASAIREFITKIGNVPNLKVDLEIVGLDKRIDENIETVLYRVIQEIVANIIKHAKATEISLQLIKHEKELSIMIEDNGVGFDTSKINTFEGIGLKNIISRIEFINGTVHFDSTINHGTTVVIEVIA
ncbi:MAG: sensor histidine kinase [Bacteroidota bacterium]|nr:sensor histidine kinase [Bacteroidota bacterium]